MTADRRIAVVGAGYFSQFHYGAWRRIDDVDIVSLAAKTMGEAAQAAAKHGVPRHFDDVDQLLDEVRPDLLDIASPPPTHREFVLAALDRGIPVVCQKPFTLGLDEAEEIAAASEKCGVPVIVHDNFRFQPWYREIKRQLDQGTLGDIYQVTFQLRPGDGQGKDAYLDRQPYFQTMEKLLVHETAIHLIDVFRYLMGDVGAVYADLRRLNPAIAGEDAGLILMDFADGARGVFDGNRLVDHVAEDQRLTMGEMMIEGSAGTLRLNGDGGLFLRPHGENRYTELRYEWANKGFAGDCVYALLRHVVDGLWGAGRLENTAGDYIRNLKIEEAVYRSSADGRKVSLTG